MPARLGRYAVRRRIGSGGFATVWLAYDEQLDSPVAVKVLADNWTEDHQVRQRFLEEGRYLRKVESPHVVSVYDAGELEDGRPYLVMSYADQGTLADRLEVEGLSSAQVLEVVRQVGEGLQALHERGILHRDVKPANVLFRSVDGAQGQTVRAMVGDLGLGKALDMSSRLTMVAGTPTYVAPEQAAAESPDARADQYSLAALTYLLLTRQPPFRHASLADAMHPLEVVPASSVAPGLPPAVDAVLARGLARDREDRYEQVTDFVDALEVALGASVVAGDQGPWLHRDPHLTQPGPRPTVRPAASALPEPAAPARSGRGRRAALLVLVGVLALVLGAGAGYAAQRQGGGGERTVTDDEDTLAVTVPAAWDGAVATGGWDPPNGEGERYAALSVGTSRDWSRAEGGQGVFVALLPGTGLPKEVPQHPECTETGRPVQDTRDGDPSTTVVYSGCRDDDGVVVEQVVRVARNLVLWIQVRSDTRGTATEVLGSVRSSGV